MAKIARGYGGGGFYQKDGIYFLRYQVNGHRKATCLHCTKLEDAYKKAEEVLPKSLQAAHTKEQVAVHIAEARKLTKTEVSKLKLDEVWATYEATPSRPQSAAGTLKNYKRCWKKFSDWLLSKYPHTVWLSSITPNMAKEYAMKLGAKAISASTYNYHIGALRLICRILGEDTGLEENPFSRIERKTGIKQQRKEFTLREVRDILESFAHFEDHPKRPKLEILNHAEMKMLFHLLAFSGLRLADAALLKWESVDENKGMISTHPIKTRHVASTRQVHIPICQELAGQLEAAKEWKDDSGYVMPKVATRYQKNPSGVAEDCIRIITWNEFTEWNGARKCRNRRKYGVHSFRHFFASHCAANGVPISLLADVLGDNISTLQRYYIHVNDEARKKVLAALPSAESVILPSSQPMRQDVTLEKINEIILSSTAPEQKVVAITELGYLLDGSTP